MSRGQSLNALRLGAEDTAEVIKARMLHDAVPLTVYIDPTGKLRTTRITGAARRMPDLPGAWWVGSYTPKVPQVQIEDDVAERLRELDA